MPKRMRAVEFMQLEVPDKLNWQSLFLVYLDGGTSAHDAQFRMLAAEPVLHRVNRRCGDNNSMAGKNFQAHNGLQVCCHFGLQQAPLEVASGVQGEFATRLGNRIAIEGDAGTVRAAITHLNEHGRQQLAQLRIEVVVLQVNANDSAHSLPANAVRARLSPVLQCTPS